MLMPDKSFWTLIKRVLLITFTIGIGGCTNTSAVEQTTGVRYPDDPKQIDHWMSGAQAWRYWDVDAPINQLVDWSFAEKAVTLRVQASDSLNLYSTVPHTISFKVLQLTDVSGFKTLAQSSGGIRTMLLEDQEMIPNVIYIESFLLAPGEITTIVMPRQQDAKFIAVLGGFKDLEPKRSARLLTIPVVTVPAPLEEQSFTDKLTNKLSLGLLDPGVPTGPDSARPATLKFDLEFGEQGIDLFAAKAY
jgi:predicted component of type VI protein secretion system|tara:strand:+ start:1522 stop:2262 length:741 start_codon:yes stop_codon:yes gene_type:complete